MIHDRHSSSTSRKAIILAPNDHSVWLFAKTLALALMESGWTVGALCEADQYWESLKETGVERHAVPFPRFIDPLGDLAYLRTVRAVLRRAAPDVVVNLTPKPIIYGTTAARWAGVPHVVCGFRGMGRLYDEDAGQVMKALRVVVDELYRRACRKADLVWVTNPGDYERMLGQGILVEDRTILTRNGIDVRKFSRDQIPSGAPEGFRAELGVPAGVPVVVMVARALWAKGVREFVHAAKVVRGRWPESWFVLVGAAEPQSPGGIPLETLEGWNEEGTVTWLGHRDDVPVIYAASDLAVLPSYYPEGGYPRALLEPMAMGLPVVTTDTPGCRGAVLQGETGFLVPPRDGDALAETVLRLLVDQDLRVRMGQAGTKRVSDHFDERSVGRTIAEAVVALVEGRRNSMGGR